MPGYDLHGETLHGPRLVHADAELLGWVRQQTAVSGRAPDVGALVDAVLVHARYTQIMPFDDEVIGCSYNSRATCRELVAGRLARLEARGLVVIEVERYQSLGMSAGLIPRVMLTDQGKEFANRVLGRHATGSLCCRGVTGPEGTMFSCLTPEHNIQPDGTLRPVRYSRPVAQ